MSNEYVMTVHRYYTESRNAFFEMTKLELIEPNPEDIFKILSVVKT